MIHYLYKRNKDYSRYSLLKEFTKNLQTKNDIYLLFPFSKTKFIKYFSKRNQLINDFFISSYDTYVYDRKKAMPYSPTVWWKYFQDWINFRFSKYLITDTKEHFLYWEKLFGKFNGKLLVMPVLADQNIYFPQNKTPNSISKILFFGSFIPLHGIDIILEAFHILDQEKIKYEAEIIGNGQMFDSMQQLHVSLCLQNVQMNGSFLSENQLAKKINEATLILGIFGDSQKAKSVVPNKVYQAMACKKPIITMQSKAIDEFFTSNEIRTCQNTPNDLAKTIITLLKHADISEKIASNGYNKFITLYQKTENEIKEFIFRMDRDLGKY